MPCVLLSDLRDNFVNRSSMVDIKSLAARDFKLTGVEAQLF